MGRDRSTSLSDWTVQQQSSLFYESMSSGSSVRVQALGGNVDEGRDDIRCRDEEDGSLAVRLMELEPIGEDREVHELREWKIHRLLVGR
jgi:hypothetical protein